jgi:hypothetical protein
MTEAVRQDAAFEITAQRALGTGRDGRTDFVLRGQHGIEMALHHLVEHRLRRATRAIQLA